MAKLTSKDLIEKAQKLIEQAKKMEEAEAAKIGKFVLNLYKQKKIVDPELNKQLDLMLNGKSINQK
ncbi:MAG: hypothetical protein ACK5Z5_05655 [Neisseriaceae bacterium]|jgi:hypothetical protein